MKNDLKTALIYVAAVNCQVKAMGMQAENDYRKHIGSQPAHDTGFYGLVNELEAEVQRIMSEPEEH